MKLRFVAAALAAVCFAMPGIVTSPIPIFWGIEKK
jgi:hypothetical protein